MYQVMDAEKQKAESGALHQEKTLKFHAAESKVRKTTSNVKLLWYLSHLFKIGTILRTKVQVKHCKITTLLRGEAGNEH